MSKEIKYTDAVPNSIVTRYKEDNIQYLLDQVARLTAENAMLKEKWLTSKQPEQEQEQEPVAWIYEWVDEAGEPVKSVAYNFYDDANLIPLYTAPPKQPESTAEAIMPNGVCVSNVYDAYEEGLFLFALLFYVLLQRLLFAMSVCSR